MTVGNRAVDDARIDDTCRHAGQIGACIQEHIIDAQVTDVRIFHDAEQSQIVRCLCIRHIDAADGMSVTVESALEGCIVRLAGIVADGRCFRKSLTALQHFEVILHHTAVDDNIICQLEIASATEVRNCSHIVGQIGQLVSSANQIRVLFRSVTTGIVVSLCRYYQ